MSAAQRGRAHGDGRTFQNTDDMNRLGRFIMLAAAAAALTACGNAGGDGNPVVTIDSGKVQGVLAEDGSTIVFKGIPYAAPPVGELRWQKPQPVAAWDTVRVCDSFGPAAVQPPHSDPESFYTKEFYWEGDPEFNEDCLYLNVWTPGDAAGKPEKKLPVAVWIHGGAYTNGWGHEVTMDGQAWAERGVILVTINYRLGIFGFLCHPLLAEEAGGTCGNYGTWDQAAALQWVKRNISGFGGDPDNITVFGQSAGAASVKNMVASPVTRGLLSRAIIQSGGGLGEFIRESPMEQSMAIGKDIMDMAGCTTLEQMRALSTEQVQGLLGQYMAAKKTYLMLSPVTDGELLPKGFDQAALDGEIADIPYMIGWNLDDMSDMTEPIGRFATTREQQSQQPTYVYEFMRRLPGDDSGAFHSAELWYMFGTLDNSWRPFTEADHLLSEQMLDAWTNFAKYGNPNGDSGNDSWKPYTAANPEVHKFDVAE